MFTKYRLRQYNFKLVIFVLALAVIGIMAVSSADESLYHRQMWGVIGGTVIMVILSLFDYNLILSGEILSLKDYEDHIQQGRLYIFTDESADAVKSILNDNMPRGVRYTIGHYKEGML